MRRLISKWLLNNYIPKDMLPERYNEMMDVKRLVEENKNICDDIYDAYNRGKSDCFISVMMIQKNNNTILSIIK